MGEGWREEDKKKMSRRQPHIIKPSMRPFYGQGPVWRHRSHTYEASPGYDSMNTNTLHLYVTLQFM